MKYVLFLFRFGIRRYSPVGYLLLAFPRISLRFLASLIFFILIFYFKKPRFPVFKVHGISFWKKKKVAHPYGTVSFAKRIPRLHPPTLTVPDRVDPYSIQYRTTNCRCVNSSTVVVDCRRTDFLFAFPSFFFSSFLLLFPIP